jgi:hypothetical protein
VGKSTLIEKMFDTVPSSLIHMPVPGRYFLTSMCESRCMAVIFEEFDPDVFQSKMCQIKRLLEAKEVVTEDKYGMPKVLVYEGPVIFVSNYPPRDTPGFRRRVEVVYAWRQAISISFLASRGI